MNIPPPPLFFHIILCRVRWSSFATYALFFCVFSRGYTHAHKTYRLCSFRIAIFCFVYLFFLIFFALPAITFTLSQDMETAPQDDAGGAEALKPVPVLSAHAGDLRFEYTPACDPAAPGGEGRGRGGMGEEAGEEKESNRAPSPGGYMGSRTIHVVSFVCVRVTDFIYFLCVFFVHLRPSVLQGFGTTFFFFF